MEEVSLEFDDESKDSDSEAKTQLEGKNAKNSNSPPRNFQICAFLALFSQLHLSLSFTHTHTHTPPPPPPPFFSPICTSSCIIYNYGISKT
jgi:hypothetical protein